MRAINKYPDLLIDSENKEEAQILLAISMSDYCPRSAGITDEGNRRLHLVPSEVQTFCEGLLDGTAPIHVQMSIVNCLHEMISDHNSK